MLERRGFIFNLKTSQWFFFFFLDEDSKVTVNYWKKYEIFTRTDSYNIDQEMQIIVSVTIENIMLFGWLLDAIIVCWYILLKYSSRLSRESWMYLARLIKHKAGACEGIKQW